MDFTEGRDGVEIGGVVAEDGPESVRRDTWSHDLGLALSERVAGRGSVRLVGEERRNTL